MIARVNQQMNKQRGIVIIEAAIAFLLVAIGIVGLVLLSAKSSRASQESFERTEAITLASQIAAKVRASGDSALVWHGLDVANPGSMTNMSPAMQTAIAELKTKASERLFQPNARVTLTATDGVSACAAVPCEVLVDVSWTGASNQARSYTIVSYVGLQ